MKPTISPTYVGQIASTLSDGHSIYHEAIAVPNGVKWQGVTRDVLVNIHRVSRQIQASDDILRRPMGEMPGFLQLLDRLRNPPPPIPWEDELASEFAQDAHGVYDQ